MAKEYRNSSKEIRVAILGEFEFVMGYNLLAKEFGSYSSERVFYFVEVLQSQPTLDQLE
jgi:hypothetical protein